ncbi:hemagglutinin repeat-containing protein, partial [Gilliamella sp. B3825]
MNKDLYRVIFNKKRGMQMVVADIAKTHTGHEKSTSGLGQTSSKSVLATLKLVTLLMSISFGFVTLSLPAHGSQIIADLQAKKTQQAQVIQAANGVTQVNIQTPNKKGLSHNKYKQFDVSQRGVILNNSGKITQTQIGGYVQGNEYLKTGSAKIILNEVNSRNPSQLNGVIEVAGQKAQVIIANPSGISCHGCGFINADRSTLTTGKPIIDNGELTGYQVEQGHISVAGKGLDSTGQSYTDLIARSVSINSAVWANDLNVVTGRNKVSRNAQTITPLAEDNSPKPEVALDVSALGGMYAGKIQMVGTEKGVGVRNAGELGSSKGHFSLTTEGKIVNTGTWVSQGNMTVKAKGRITNAGSIGSQAGLQVSTTGQVSNSGKILSKENLTLKATDNIRNAGVINSQTNLQINTGGDLNNSGNIQAHGDIALGSDKTFKQEGRILSKKNIVVTANDIVQTESGLMASGVTADGEVPQGGDLTLRAAQHMHLHGAVQATKNAIISAKAIDGQGLKLSSDTLTLNAGAGAVNLDNAAVYVDGQATIHGIDGVSAKHATLSADALTLHGATIDNREGTLFGKTALNLTTQHLDNQQGKVLSQGQLTIAGSAQAYLNNLNNQDGTISSLSTLKIGSHTLAGNRNGRIESGQDMFLTVISDWINQQTILANGQLTLNASGRIDNQSQIKSGGQLTLTARELYNQQDGDIAGGSTRISTTQLTNYGVIDGGLTDIQTDTLNNLDSGRIYGDAVMINTGKLTNLKSAAGSVAPVIGARDRLLIGARELLNKDHALLLSQGEMFIGGQASTQGVTGRSQQVSNHSATIEAGGSLYLAADKLDNRDLYVKISSPVEVDRKSYHDYEWCSGDKDKYSCFGGNQKRYRISDNREGKFRYIIDENGKKTGEGHLKFDKGNHVRFYVKGLRHSKHFIEYFYDRVIYESQLLNQDPAKIQAGKNLIIQGDVVTNQDSQLLSGQTMQINARQFDNLETKGERWIKEVDSKGHENRGRISHYKKEKDDHNWKTKQKYGAYQGVNTTEAMSLGTLTVAENTQLSPVSTIADKEAVTVLPPEFVQCPTVVPIKLPDNTIFQIRPEKESLYLVETDPRFTNRKKWISSLDFIDSDSLQKRLGDGYYEQKLIQDQLIALTGKSYLSGYNNSDDQYRDLLLAGQLYSKQYQLQPGVALSEEQMAALTTDMVWMVNQAITLPDGRVEVVSVPKLYLVGKHTGVNLQGNIVHAGQVNIQTQEDINNQGVISGDKIAASGHNIINRGTIAGDSVWLEAKQDIINQSGLLQAKTELDAYAGRDIILTTEQHQSGKERWLDNTATVYVSDKEGILRLTGQRNININAADIISNGKETTLIAGNYISLGTQTISHATDYTLDSKNYDRRESTQEVGSSISTAGNLTLKAGHDVKVKASDINSDGNIVAQAGKDILITAGQATYDHEARAKSSTKSTFSKSKYSHYGEEHNKTAIGSSLSGESVTLNAGHDLTVSGSQVVGTDDVNLQAGNNVNIDAAEESYYKYQQTINKKSGLMSSGGLGVTIGKTKEDLKQTDTEKAYVGSVVGSTQGNVNIQAGKDIKVRGSDIIAQQDVNLKAENVEIASLDAKTTYKEEYSYEKSGLTVALTGTVANIYEAAQALERAKHKDNDKIMALQSIKSGLTITEEIQNLQLKNDKGQSQASIGVSAMVGTQRTERVVNQEQHNVISSGVSAGKNINIIATGDANKNGGDITLKGSDIKAGNDINLTANRDLNVIGAVNTQHSDRDEKSYGAAVGIQFQVGGDESGLRFKANGNFSREREVADGSAWTESVIDAKNKLNIKTGNDVNVVGGQLKGDTVKMDVGNNLNIQSLQDTDDYDYEKISASVSGTAGTGFSANGSISATNIDSKWASVTDQSGIFAGKGGYDIYVGNNTDLKGAVIASEAEDKSKNKLDTGTISFSDIKNKADFKVTHVSVSGGTGGPGVPTAYQNSDSDSSTTKSAVEKGELIIRNKEQQKQDINELSRDTESANNP